MPNNHQTLADYIDHALRSDAVQVVTAQPVTASSVINELLERVELDDDAYEAICEYLQVLESEK